LQVLNLPEPTSVITVCVEGRRFSFLSQAALAAPNIPFAITPSATFVTVARR
jgi:hypothetical protein